MYFKTLLFDKKWNCPWSYYQIKTAQQPNLGWQSINWISTGIKWKGSDSCDFKFCFPQSGRLSLRTAMTVALCKSLLLSLHWWRKCWKTRWLTRLTAIVVIHARYISVLLAFSRECLRWLQCLVATSQVGSGLALISNVAAALACAAQHTAAALNKR